MREKDCGLKRPVNPGSSKRRGWWSNGRGKRSLRYFAWRVRLELRVSDHVYAWVLREPGPKKKNGLGFLGTDHLFLHYRAGLKNPSYKTDLYFNIKLFESKDAALEYLEKKSQVVGPTGLRPFRKKVFFNEDGYVDFYRSFKKRRRWL